MILFHRSILTAYNLNYSMQLCKSKPRPLSWFLWSETSITAVITYSLCILFQNSFRLCAQWNHLKSVFNSHIPFLSTMCSISVKSFSFLSLRQPHIPNEEKWRSKYTIFVLWKIRDCQYQLKIVISLLPKVTIRVNHQINSYSRSKPFLARKLGHIFDDSLIFVIECLFIRRALGKIALDFLQKIFELVSFFSRGSLWIVVLSETMEGPDAGSPGAPLCTPMSH